MGTRHTFSKTTNNHSLTGSVDYADITARDADSDFNTNSDSVDKIVRVEDAGGGNVGYFLLTSISPTWLEVGGGSSIFISGTPVANQSAFWTGPSTLKGEPGVLYDGTAFTIVGDLIVDTNTLYVDSTNNRVGIKTITPSTVLDVGGDKLTDGLTIRSGDDSTFPNSTSHILFGFNGTDTFRHSIRTSHDGSDKEMSRIAFYLWEPLVDNVLDIGTRLVLTLSADGKLGIGEAITPRATLDVISVGDDVDPVVITESTGANAGKTSKFVGTLDPVGNITGTGGDEYIRTDTNLSGTFENRANTSNTNWFKRSVDPPSAIEILSSAQFNSLATGGVITIDGNRTFFIKGTIGTSNRIVVDNGVLFHMIGGYSAKSMVTYTGSDTFITSNGGSIAILSGMMITSSSTGTFMSMSGGGALNIRDTDIEGWDDLGTYSDGNFINSNLFYINCTSGWTITDPLVMSAECTLQGTDLTDTLFEVNTKNPDTDIEITVFSTALASSAALVDLDTRINDDATVTVFNSSISDGNIFKPSTASATINTVADASLASGTITQMADNGSSGTTISSATVYLEDETVTQTATTNYNGTFRIFNVVAGVSYDIFTAFVGDDATGTVNSARLSIGLAGGHGISTGDNIKITGTNFYNGFVTSLNISGDTLTVNGDFVSTNTGTIERDGSLDETDPRVSAIGNKGINNSHIIASAYVNNNATANGAIVNNTFTDMVFGTTGSALIASSVMERWRLKDEVNGTFEYIQNRSFDGFITFDFTVESSGGTVDFRFKWEKSTDGGSSFNDLDDAIESLIAIGSDAGSVTKTFSLRMNKGDLIRPQITRNSGSSGITTIYATVYAVD